MKESRVELYERIRKDHRDEKLGVRALARRHGVHRRTVHQALSSAVPPSRKTPERESPALGPWKETVRAELANTAADVTIAQEHAAGEDAEVTSASRPRAGRRGGGSSRRP